MSLYWFSVLACQCISWLVCSVRLRIWHVARVWRMLGTFVLGFQNLDTRIWLRCFFFASCHQSEVCTLFLCRIQIWSQNCRMLATTGQNLGNASTLRNPLAYFCKYVFMFVQLFGQLFDQISEQKYDVQIYCGREIQCSGLLGQKFLCSPHPNH